MNKGVPREGELVLAKIGVNKHRYTFAIYKNGCWLGKRSKTFLLRAPVVDWMYITEDLFRFSQMSRKDLYTGYHREMWTWIANTIQEQQEVCNIFELESEWCAQHGLNLCNFNAGCEYSKSGGCSDCLFSWNMSDEGQVSCMNPQSYYYRCYHSTDWCEQVVLARAIATLPVRKEV